MLQRWKVWEAWLFWFEVWLFWIFVNVLFSLGGGLINYFSHTKKRKKGERENIASTLLG